jgi:uncharacterized protein (DUF2141 family)
VTGLSTPALLRFAAATTALLLSSAGARADDPATTGDLAVQVVGVQGEAGAVCVALHDDAGTYPDEGRHLRFSCAKIADGKALVVFEDLAPGDYAAFAFHDEDGDRRLKKNFIGMPKEGVGASRGAKGFMGPPKFEDAKVAVGPGKTHIRIKLKYL